MARRRVVVVGSGFAGYNAAKELADQVSPDHVEIVLVNPTDYFLYLPLLPEVAAGIVEPRAVAIPVPGKLRNVRLILGDVRHVDTDAHELTYVDPENTKRALTYDKLVLSVGSVNKLLPIPGLAEHGHGFRGIPEALYLRDHMTRQIELAAATGDQQERDARCTFVVVGAGYTGTEVAAQGHLFTTMLARQRPELSDQPIRWLLLDTAPRVLPGLDERMSKEADAVLRRRGVEVMTETSISEATKEGVVLQDGTDLPTRTLLWCVGVRPDPLVESTGMETVHGRLVVDEQLQVPGFADIFACGDAAAVPNPRDPGELCPMTAQHAVRQGKVAGRNVAASLGYGTPRRYRYRDLGFVVDLGGKDAAANPLHIPMSGLLAKVVTRGYHLVAMPGNRARVALDWVADALFSRQRVQLGLVRSGVVPLDTAAPEYPKLLSDDEDPLGVERR